VTNVKGEAEFLAYVAGRKDKFDIQLGLMESSDQKRWGWQEWAQYARSQEKGDITKALSCNRSCIICIH
jgi:hypothetical protein